MSDHLFTTTTYRPVETPSRDAVLTAEQLSEALQISPPLIEASDFPTWRPGKGKLKRYVYGQVLDVMMERAQ